MKYKEFIVLLFLSIFSDFLYADFHVKDGLNEVDAILLKYSPYDYCSIDFDDLNKMKPYSCKREGYSGIFSYENPETKEDILFRYKMKNNNTNIGKSQKIMVDKNDLINLGKSSQIFKIKTKTTDYEFYCSGLIMQLKINYITSFNEKNISKVEYITDLEKNTTKTMEEIAIVNGDFARIVGTTKLLNFMKNYKFGNIKIGNTKIYMPKVKNNKDLSNFIENCYEQIN